MARALIKVPPKATRGEVIEIQGDVRERIKPELERRGYTVKIAGG